MESFNDAKDDVLELVGCTKEDANEEKKVEKKVKKGKDFNNKKKLRIFP